MAAAVAAAQVVTVGFVAVTAALAALTWVIVRLCRIARPCTIVHPCITADGMADPDGLLAAAVPCCLVF